MKTSNRIKRFVLLFFLIQTIVIVNAQDKKPLDRDLYIDFGFKYVPIDYVGGPVFGLSYHSPDKKLSINMRYDIGISIGRGSHFDVIDTIIFKGPENHFSIQQFQVRTFLEAELLVWESNKRKLSASAGLGWNYLGWDQMYLLNEASGYYCITIAAKYKLSWFYIEPRIDISISNNTYYSDEKLFPGSIALIYRFKPKERE